MRLPLCLCISYQTPQASPCFGPSKDVLLNMLPNSRLLVAFSLKHAWPRKFLSLHVEISVQEILQRSKL
ncbi:hypothetical protein FRX31_032126 [Thalictrum thalictroides]|uniref:Uncharacterized protein n=1 Tax=Thalictrum thalictroides TaxID=46969 RepID=A0A7J6V032_THATH|nr:hypothetical protein FRX31_032126 [Thalictrum thalictroides]